MAHRSFESPDEEELRAEGPSFDLAGESFRCMPVPPAGVINDVLAAVDVGGDGTVRFSQINLVGFVNGVLAWKLWEWDEPEPDDEEPEPPKRGSKAKLADRTGAWVEVDDRARWKALLHDEERPIRVETLGEVVVWLVQEYTNRPTKPSARSAPGRSNGAATSRAASSSRGSAGKR